MKIVLDTANGATYAVAPAVFKELGADVTVVHDSPDGFNINEGCGSQHTEDLRRPSSRRGPRSDSPSTGMATASSPLTRPGARLTGDQSLMICAKMLKDEGRLKNDLVVSTVMSNMGLRAACEKYGLKNHAAKVGDRYVLEDMRRLGAVLGGKNPVT